jgi:hypothetical protein
MRFPDRRRTNAIPRPPEDECDSPTAGGRMRFPDRRRTNAIRPYTNPIFLFISSRNSVSLGSSRQ